MARPVPGGNYSWPRVGHVETLRAGFPGKFAFVPGAEYEATKADADRFGLQEGRVYRDWTFPGYPIVLEEDLDIVGANFSQQAPHTPIFDFRAPAGSLVLPTVRLIDCNLTNVTVPDGVAIHGGNGLHGVLAATGDAARPTVRLLCECAKCVTFRRVLQDAENLPRDPQGRILHHLLKDVARARRLDSTALSDDRTWQADSNTAAMQKYGRTVTVALQTSLARGT